MLCNQIFFTSLLVASLFFSTSLRSQPPKKCERLTRAKIEEKFGKPVKCLNDSEDVECFGHEREPIRVQFNSSDVVTGIEMSTSCYGLRSLMKGLNETVPNLSRKERGSARCGKCTRRAVNCPPRFVGYRFNFVPEGKSLSSGKSLAVAVDLEMEWSKELPQHTEKDFLAVKAIRLKQIWRN